MKKQLVTIWVIGAIVVVVIFVSSFTVVRKKKIDGATFDKIVDVVAKSEWEDIEKGLKKWSDPNIEEHLSNIVLTDDYVKELHKEFKSILISPPNPENYTEYSIENAERSLIATENLGRKLHNMLEVLSDEDFKKYGRLIGMMRDVLHFDSKHIPLAIKHDNSRDIFWHDLHYNFVKQVEKEYAGLFGNE